jgi:hypothetical protein
VAAGVQLMLVSAQAAPNLLAAADTELRPQRAVLVTSPAMRDRAAALEAVLREMGVAAERLDLRNEHDPQAIAEDLLALAARLDGEQVHLNLTGGTKLMALTALAVAETAGWTSFYVDVDTDHVVWLGRTAPAPRKLNESVRLRHYLGAYGISIEGDPDRRTATAAEQAFIEDILLYYDHYLQALPLLNGALQRAEDARTLTIELSAAEQDSKSLGELLGFAQKGGLASLGGSRLTLASEGCRDFLKGGWLEQHVFDTVTQLASELPVRDRALNLTVLHRDVISELDVAFLCRNRLHVIECKTANLRLNDGGRANDALFKLAENARRLGGLATRSLLVSYRLLREPELRLARLLQVEVAHGRDLPRLREKLLAWCRQ